MLCISIGAVGVAAPKKLKNIGCVLTSSVGKGFYLSMAIYKLRH
jgi:hypothetical protein